MDHMLKVRGSLEFNSSWKIRFDMRALRIVNDRTEQAPGQVRPNFRSPTHFKSHKSPKKNIPG